jgi:hypothetical protein
MRRKEPRALVKQDQALNYAQMAVRRAWAGNVEDMRNWATAGFDPEPLIIFDLNGEPLFYEFTVRDGRQNVGRVKAAASRLVGSAVVTIERGARKWDPGKAMEQAAAIAKKEFPRRKIVARDLVCYSYPKIGVRVEFADEDGGSLIYDVADGSPIREFGSDAREPDRLVVPRIDRPG